MATYNGAEYLKEQLDSLASQTRLPSELVVSDDDSNDDTVAIVERFAQAAPFPVVICTGDRSGYGQNFLRAARNCRGDLIAWCDQDDIWLPNKLARCCSEFEKGNHTVLVVHSRQIGDWRRHGRPFIRGGPGARSDRLGRRRQIAGLGSGELLPCTAGLASIFKKEVIQMGDYICPKLRAWFLDNEGHDGWTGFLGVALGRVVFIPDVLVWYRQHKRNTVGALPSAGGATRRIALGWQRSEIDLVTRLSQDVEWAENAIAILQQLVDVAPQARPLLDAWGRRRDAALRRMEPSLSRIVSHPADYRRRSRGGYGAKSLAKDVLRARGTVK